MNINIKTYGKDQFFFSLCHFVHAVRLLLCHDVRMFTPQASSSFLCCYVSFVSKLGFVFVRLSVLVSKFNILVSGLKYWFSLLWLPWKFVKCLLNVLIISRDVKAVMKVEVSWRFTLSLSCLHDYILLIFSRKYDIDKRYFEKY